MTPDASSATTAAVGEDVAVREGAIGVTLREIARGGIAGVIAGALVAGVGGRVVMRLAAVAVPESARELHRERLRDRQHHPGRQPAG